MTMQRTHDTTQHAGFEKSALPRSLIWHLGNLEPKRGDMGADVGVGIFTKVLFPYGPYQTTVTPKTLF